MISLDVKPNEIDMQFPCIDFSRGDALREQVMRNLITMSIENDNTWVDNFTFTDYQQKFPGTEALTHMPTFNDLVREGVLSFTVERTLSINDLFVFHAQHLVPDLS